MIGTSGRRNFQLGIDVARARENWLLAGLVLQLHAAFQYPTRGGGVKGEPQKPQKL
jgi:hypothetical protein